ncbi:uncharacterized protein LOC133848678 [Drosophila sulfurigaster albostrigata]|uniref:uncharacterized protein LOC133848678 n=1 Tax=Drosophila sulfurigaster albostrigata TaxID=89887 RepID=UPI002D21B419|nr:uncharacterized protein LOC133848678 [Drosophila sulfurigaster albostrigata]
MAIVKQKTQQESTQQTLKFKSKSKSKPKSNTNQMVNVITVLKTQPTLSSKPQVAPSKKFKWRPRKPQQTVRRSKLMANALLPLMSDKRVEEHKPEQTKTTNKSRPTKATQTLLVVRDTLQLKHAAKSEKSQQTAEKKRTQRLPPMPFKHKLHPVSGGNAPASASTSTAATAAASGIKPLSSQKQNDVEVPLTTRLPIIDFISTDDFARMHAFKKAKAARRLSKQRAASNE